jgi:signal transduction histidine kinase
MAESVAVRFEADQGKITLSVVDDGIGFSTSKKHAGMGLQNMQERANAIAGELSVQSETGHGTRVTISVDTNKGM